MTKPKDKRITPVHLDGTATIEITKPAGRPVMVRWVTRRGKSNWANIHPSTVERLRELLGAVGK